ncbi:uncharacterized protein LOC135324271 [Dromaius novaehollandiae]|uniref:uncharacterized protein LOC135324271 n=1 Tax=Dromaius novaehollandiae TaxID=8790 RepID=UPI00311D3BE3
MKQYATQALSPQRAHRYELIILHADNVTLKRCNILNPATLLPLPEDGEPHHSCEQVVVSSSKPWEELKDEPLENPDLVLFTDGSSYYLDGRRHSGYAVTNIFEVLEANPLSPSVSAQGAELIALTQAAKIGKNLRVNIYTDSKYAFGVCHATGMLWKERGFFSSSGKKLANGEKIRNLLEAVQLPKEIAVIHCPAHTKDTTEISRGNALADAAAKAAARQPLKECMGAVPRMDQSEWPNLIDPKTMYEKDCSVEEKKQWEQWEAKQSDDGIWTIGEKPILPKKYLITIARWFHDKAHGGAEAIAKQVQKVWAAPGIYAAAKRITNSCPTCQKFSNNKLWRTDE